MIKLITGKKGSGKTKKLVELVNAAAEKSNGSVVCIEKGTVMTYDISHDARLIDIEHYSVGGFAELFGFIAGLCGGNYDTTDVFVDSTLKIGGDNMEALADFVAKLETLAKATDVRFTLSISADDSALPESLNAIAERV